MDNNWNIMESMDNNWVTMGIYGIYGIIYGIISTLD